MFIFCLTSDGFLLFIALLFFIPKLNFNQHLANPFLICIFIPIFTEAFPTGWKKDIE